jgi:hypothetical protein
MLVRKIGHQSGLLAYSAPFLLFTSAAIGGATFVRGSTTISAFPDRFLVLFFFLSSATLLCHGLRVRAHVGTLAVLPKTENTAEQRPTVRASHQRHLLGLLVANLAALIV